MATAGTGLRPDFDDVISGSNHSLVVLDDDYRVAGVGECTDNRNEAVDVARV